MWLLKTFIGYFPLKYGVYVSVLWNFLIMMFILAFEGLGGLFAIIEICVVVMILFSFCLCPNSPSYYMTWMINKLVLAAIFGIFMIPTLIRFSSDDILICFPILASLFALEIYFGMITFSVYYNLKYEYHNDTVSFKISKGPSNAGTAEVIISSRTSDIRSNPLFVLPMKHGIAPSCPSFSTYDAPFIQSETSVCAVVHPPVLPYQVQPAFNPAFQITTSFS